MWNISIASGELAFEPKPLSVRVRKVPSFRFLMPDRPCTGWPLSGRLEAGRTRCCLVGQGRDGQARSRACRPAGRPGRRSGRRSAAPAARRPAAGTRVMAGRTAWPSSMAGNLVWAEAGKRPARGRSRGREQQVCFHVCLFMRCDIRLLQAERYGLLTVLVDGECRTRKIVTESPLLPATQTRCFQEIAWPPHR